MSLSNSQSLKIAATAVLDDIDYTDYVDQYTRDDAKTRSLEIDNDLRKSLEYSSIPEHAAAVSAVPVGALSTSLLSPLALGVGSNILGAIIGNKVYDRLRWGPSDERKEAVRESLKKFVEKAEKENFSDAKQRWAATAVRSGALMGLGSLVALPFARELAHRNPNIRSLMGVMGPVNLAALGLGLAQHQRKSNDALLNAKLERARELLEDDAELERFIKKSSTHDDFMRELGLGPKNTISDYLIAGGLGSGLGALAGYGFSRRKNRRRNALRGAILGGGLGLGHQFLFPSKMHPIRDVLRQTAYDGDENLFRRSLINARAHRLNHGNFGERNYLQDISDKILNRRILITDMSENKSALGPMFNFPISDRVRLLGHGIINALDLKVRGDKNIYGYASTMAPAVASYNFLRTPSDFRKAAIAHEVRHLMQYPSLRDPRGLRFGNLPVTVYERKLTSPLTDRANIDPYRMLSYEAEVRMADFIANQRRKGKSLGIDDSFDPMNTLRKGRFNIRKGDDFQSAELKNIFFGKKEPTAYERQGGDQSSFKFDMHNSNMAVFEALKDHMKRSPGLL